MQKRAIVCVTNDLCTDNRVHKVCLTLQKCGYVVLEYGRLLPESKELNRPYLTKRKKHWFRRGPLFYAEYNIRLFFYLLFKKSNLVLSNDVDTLPAAFCAAKIKRTRLVFDAHELFSEVPELHTRPFIKNIWLKIEDFFIPKIKDGYTVCGSIAQYYNNKYGTDIKVIRNIPLFRNLKPTGKLSYSGKKIILYQGAVNIGRGIEWVINAMPLIDNAILIIIGDGDIKEQLVTMVEQKQLSDKVIFKGRINAENLFEYTACADIGLCLLENQGLNYYYSLPNRIFDYLHAGVPVLATKFPEIQGIVETYKTGILIDHYEPEYIASVVNEMLNTKVDKNYFYKIAYNLCWENEEQTLIKILSNQ
ncbi:MAG: glycosyltransferase family 4 protein [Paludibacter sp.]|nr:glycosyltransferase family 4 protein [Paludibacter sp.]